MVRGQRRSYTVACIQKLSSFCQPSGMILSNALAEITRASCGAGEALGEALTPFCFLGGDVPFEIVVEVAGRIGRRHAAAAAHSVMLGVPHRSFISGGTASVFPLALLRCFGVLGEK